MSLTIEEREIVEAVRKAKSAGNADLFVSFTNGHRRKIWITYKMEGKPSGQN